MEQIEEAEEYETCTCGGECHCHEQGCACECGEECKSEATDCTSSFYPKLATMRWDVDDFNDWD